MSVLQLTEPITRAIVTRLQSDLPAAVTAVNAELADGIDLVQVPNERILPFRPSIGILRDWPTIGIQHLPSQLEDDIGSSFVLAGDFAIVAFDVDSDMQALGWRLLRWERAIATAVLRDRELGAGGVDGYSVQFNRTVPGPTLGDSEDPEQVKTYHSWSAVVVEIRREE